MPAESSTVTAPGRPRSESTHRSILDAAGQLMHDLPFREVTIEGIAERAGVSKASIYRRWSNKFELTVEVLVRETLNQGMTYTGGSFRQHLITVICHLRDILSGHFSDAIAAMIAEAHGNEKLWVEFHRDYLSRAQALGEKDLQTAIDLGELDAAVDPEMIHDQLFGFLHFRLLVERKEADDAFIERIVDRALRGYYLGGDES